MLPVVAIVGRPNVGKSTLFNRLTRSRSALISSYPGTTRDRQYGEVSWDGCHFIIIDTGGITEEMDEVGKLITQQALQAIEDSDKVLFLVDAKTGILPEDKIIAETLRRSGKHIFLIVNKTEGMDPVMSVTDAYELGLGTPLAIAAVHGSGMANLITSLFPEPAAELVEASETSSIKLAIVGRPNVGKSTLTNRMLGEERVIVHDSPGTTRDSIFVPLERFGKHYILIDTAGIRKRKKIEEVPEKFSVVKTLQSIESSNVVLYVVDARLGVSEQDLKLLGFVLECGKALVVAINKWDGMTEDARDRTKATIDRHLDFVRFARVHYISALHGSGVGNLFDSIHEAYESATKKLSTPLLSRLLQKAQTVHQPPLVKGRRVKLRYAHPGGYNPPCIVIHGNQLHALPESYRKFLAHFFQKELHLFGTPVFIEFKTSENPFSHK
ncbi:MAG: ribosome biogenesis GTPase Der [Gammaproteobacteria bacterium]|nr:ribosome biogenesis GTPase Der [Gammaproteobacteria bacterium]MCW5582788.1 ribosome biogenesis GTPase Der [Gammaproteobacteria bacterium]